MAKTLVNYNLGPAGTPQDVQDLRKSSYDLHNELGFPVMFKHRWTAKDAANGLTRPCPLHDDLYAGRDSEWDKICFGTGYVGGYADGQVVFVTIQDTQEAQIKIGPSGVLTMDMHPALTAPWLPKMADGDLIILVEFDSNEWTVIDEEERYVLRDVAPISMRGPGWGRQKGLLINRQTISQQSALDKLPSTHPLYRVPIVFDYSVVPGDTTPPFVVNDPATPAETQYSEVFYVAKIRGIENTSQEPVTTGTEVMTQRTVRMFGTSSEHGSHIIF